MASDQGVHCLPFIQQFLNTSTGSKTDLFKLGLHRQSSTSILEFYLGDMKFYREVDEELRLGDTKTTFRSLCPPALTDRKTAAIKFTALLGM